MLPGWGTAGSGRPTPGPCCPSPKPHPTQWTTADALSRQAKERLGDCRQEGRPAVRVRRAATEGRRTFWGWGGEQPDGRTGPIVANRLTWIRPPGGRSDGGGDRLRESG